LCAIYSASAPTGLFADSRRPLRGKVAAMAPALRSFVTSAQARARVLFPDLRLTIRLADGSNRTIRVPDPRAAVAAAYEAEGTGTPCLKRRRPHRVVIVDKPDGWQPTSPSDLPPDVEVHHEPTARNARLLARGFNKAELLNPKGYWAIDIDRRTAAGNSAPAVVNAVPVQEACACHRAEG